MDTPTFIVEFIKALAWPLVAIVVIAVFHKKITDLFEKVEELKGLGIEAKFNRELKVVAEETKQVVQQERGIPVVGEIDATSSDDLIEAVKAVNVTDPLDVVMVEINPLGSVLASRSLLERMLVEMFKEHTGYYPGLLVSMEDVANKLLEDGVITKQLRSTIADVMRLGNKAAHEQVDIQPISARGYNKIVQSLVTLLKARRKA